MSGMKRPRKETRFGMSILVIYSVSAHIVSMLYSQLPDKHFVLYVHCQGHTQLYALTSMQSS